MILGLRFDSKKTRNLSAANELSDETVKQSRARTSRQMQKQSSNTNTFPARQLDAKFRGDISRMFLELTVDEWRLCLLAEIKTMLAPVWGAPCAIAKGRWLIVFLENRRMRPRWQANTGAAMSLTTI